MGAKQLVTIRADIYVSGVAKNECINTNGQSAIANLQYTIPLVIYLLWLMSIYAYICMAEIHINKHIFAWQ